MIQSAPMSDKGERLNVKEDQGSFTDSLSDENFDGIDEEYNNTAYDPQH